MYTCTCKGAYITHTVCSSAVCFKDGSSNLSAFHIMHVYVSIVYLPNVLNLSYLHVTLACSHSSSSHPATRLSRFRQLRLLPELTPAPAPAPSHTATPTAAVCRFWCLPGTHSNFSSSTGTPGCALQPCNHQHGCMCLHGR